MQQNNQEKLTGIRKSIRTQLAENPGMLLEPLARENGLSLAEVIELLPEGTWQRTDGSRFIEIMKALTTLGKMTIIVNTGDVIFEYAGEVPNGGIAHGYYNLSPKSPLHGHLRHENCKTIYLVERPFMNTPTVSIQFFNGEGRNMFNVYAGRDDNRKLLIDQVEAMRALFKSEVPGASV